MVRTKISLLMALASAALVAAGLGLAAAPALAAATYTVNATASAGGSITPSGTFTVNYGDSPTFTMVPNTGFHVTSVLVDGVEIGPVASFSYTYITNNVTVAATFVANAATNNIVASAGAGGTVTPAGTTSVTFGANQSYTIAPNAGFAIDAVTVDGNSVGAVSSYQFTNVTMPHTIGATFVANSYNIVSSTGANGTISPLGTTAVTSGSSQTYTITPVVGFHIADVLVDGVSAGAVSVYTFNQVSAAHTISASFLANGFSIVSSVGANGTISPLGTTTVTAGATQAYTITPNAGYSVASVLVDGVAAGTVTSYSFINVVASHTISATFSATTSTVAIALNPGWNVITLPLQPIDVATGLPISYTADSFGLLAGADVVSGYDSALQQYNSHIVGIPLNDFPLTSGMGFFVHVAAAKSISLTGTAFALTTPTLATGWNLLGWTSSTPIAADTYGLSFPGTGLQVSAADVVSKYDSVAQLWVSHIVGLPLNNFTLNQGDGVFVHKP